jgi:diadenosine tetraphosphatase ApaH/serine/threonine PP2A family protein phosphatase
MPRGRLIPVRLLILSDIHSNHEALDACLEVAPSFDRVANLGDVVGYGASPNEVTHACRQIDWISVRGNHDKVCTGIESADSFNPIAAMAAMWTRVNLSEENLAWLRALPAGPLIVPELEDVQFVHGSPLNEDRYTVTMLDAIDALASSRAAITFFGHTHIQGAFYLNGGEGPWELRPAAHNQDVHETQTVYLLAGSRYLINPGSVGQPRDGDWRASFALYDSNQHTVVFHRVPYDVRRTQERIREARLPDRLALRLEQGR